MRTLIALIAFSVTLLMATVAHADHFFVERLSGRGSLNASQIQNLNQILKREAGRILPGPVLSEKDSDSTLIKPTLQAENGGKTKLILERYDMGELFSTIEVSVDDTLSSDRASDRASERTLERTLERACSRGLRELVFGPLRSAEIGSEQPVATR